MLIILEYKSGPTSKIKATLFKVDFKKTYDMVNSNFLGLVLLQMQFPPLWRSWIDQNWFSLTHFSILINGPRNYFVSKGLQQCDTMCSYLFTLVIGSLNLSIRVVETVAFFMG